MPVLLFYQRFHAPILDGRKCLTIRAKRARPIRVGDRLSLRAWTGAGFRSPQRVLLDTVCSVVLPVRIEDVDGRLAVALGDDLVVGHELGELARADGFAGAEEMLGYWQTPRRGLPFEGELFGWREFRAKRGGKHVEVKS